MLHELVYSWGVIRSSHRILTRSHRQPYSCKILQPYFAATVRTHSDAVLFSSGAFLMKIVIKSNRQ